MTKRTAPVGDIKIDSLAEVLTDYNIVYKATNKINDKSYIGLSKRDLETRIKEHHKAVRRGSKSHFHRALRKYGLENFKWCILNFCSSNEGTSLNEQKMIKHYNSYENGYNMTTGGESNWTKVTSEETKQKLSKLYKGKTYEEIHGTEMAKEIKTKQSKWHTGKHVSEETRKRMSEANKRRWVEGNNIGKKGKACLVLGVEYSSMKEAIDDLKIYKDKLKRWIATGKNGAKLL